MLNKFQTTLNKIQTIIDKTKEEEKRQKDIKDMQFMGNSFRTRFDLDIISSITLDHKLFPLLPVNDGDLQQSYQKKSISPFKNETANK
jgi:hypothetical protein